VSRRESSIQVPQRLTQCAAFSFARKLESHDQGLGRDAQGSHQPFVGPWLAEATVDVDLINSAPVAGVAVVDGSCRREVLFILLETSQRLRKNLAAMTTLVLGLQQQQCSGGRCSWRGRLLGSMNSAVLAVGGVGANHTLTAVLVLVRAAAHHYRLLGCPVAQVTQGGLVAGRMR
jgi:hypothetical protein